MASALETLCGQAYGAKNYQMMGIYMQRSCIILFISSILLLPLFVFATPILKLTGQSTAVAELSGVVALWLIPMHLSFGFLFTVQRFLQCQLKNAVIAWVSGGVLAVHVFVSWFFVYKLRVGIVGTALTLDFSWWLAFFILFGYSVCGGCPNSWNGFSMQAFVGLWEFVKLSVASGVMLSLENFYYRILVIVSGYMMDAEVADRVRVANELGAGNAKGAKFAATLSVLISLIISLLVWSITIAFPDKLAMVFTSSTAVISMVKELSGLLAFTILLNCIQPILSGVAVGCGWQAWVAIINIGSYYLVGIPLGIILGWSFGFSIKGIWAGMISGTVVQTLILIFITIRYHWDDERQKGRLSMAYQEDSSS